MKQDSLGKPVLSYLLLDIMPSQPLSNKVISLILFSSVTHKPDFLCVPIIPYIFFLLLKFCVSM